MIFHLILKRHSVLFHVKQFYQFNSFTLFYFSVKLAASHMEEKKKLFQKFLWIYNGGGGGDDRSDIKF